MDINSLFSKIESTVLSSNSAVVNQKNGDITVVVNQSNAFFNVKLYTDLDEQLINPAEIDKLLHQLNNSQGLGFLYYEKPTLSLKMCMLVDCKPSETTLREVISSMIASLNVVKITCERTCCNND